MTATFCHRPFRPGPRAATVLRVAGALALVILYLAVTGCATCQPRPVPVIEYCTVADPKPPDLTCPPRQTEADVALCAEARATARAAYEAQLRAALAACRKPK